MYARGNKPQDKQSATPSKYPQGRFNIKKCRCCGKPFQPKAPSHFYCSQECADVAHASAYLQRNYGISFADYNGLLKKQGGKCAICGGEGFLMKACHRIKLVVDHDHATGKVRGLLCHNCNRALGLLHDNPVTINNALEYLKVQRPS